MRFRPRPLLHLLAALATLAGPTAVSAGELKAVLELFTSQACSSCPKADKLLGEYAADPRVVALSLPVDYWDYLGWRDTLALHAHSTRQKAYAIHRGDRQVYTPQIIINGAAEAVGSDRWTIERIVGSIDQKSKLVVPVSLKRGDGKLDIEIGSAAAPSATIWVVGVTKKSPVAIERGENRGKTITYHNVIRVWQQLGEWKGNVVRASVPVAELAQSGADSAAVLVQAGTVESPGPICGAAMTALR
ncbi:MAG: DUF1223 domain-containing protein [Bradyrhizobiaceae bacterium]|nr:DUF1223 domain-containing protein [Bradyrhizobiaceae bacterium]